MKRSNLFFIPVLILIIAVPAMSQTGIGLVGGLNMAKFDVKTPGEYTEVSYKNLFGVGAVVDFKLNDHFSLYMQPMYLQKGAVVKDTYNDTDFPFTSAYIELPVFIRMEFGSHIKPYLLAGPTFGYLLNAKVKTDVSGYTFEGDYTKVTEKLDFGLGVGAGIRIPFDSFSAFVEGRYSFGLLNAQKGGMFEIVSGQISETITWDKDKDAYKNRGIQIIVGIIFPLGGK